MQNVYISNYLKLPRIDLLPREVNNADVLSIFLSNNEQTVNQSSSRSNVYERGCYTSGLFNNGSACANSAIFKGNGRVNTNVRQHHLAHLGWYHCIHVLTKKMAGSGSNVSSSTVERIKQLDAVEGDIINAIQSAGNFIWQVADLMILNQYEDTEEIREMYTGIV